MSNPPKERGTAWERRVVDHANLRGLDWERAPLRGPNDLLDIQGCLKPDGLLIGCKGISRRGNLQDRMSEGMNEARAAVARLPRIFPVEGLVVGVQVVQRQGATINRAYVVMEYDPWLDWVEERRKWRTNQ